MTRAATTEQRPIYRLPVYRLGQTAFYMLRNQPRNLGQDFRFLINNLPATPVVAGSDNLPATGPCVLVANHYERPGLWMGWSGAMLARAVHEHSGLRLRLVAITEWSDYRLGPFIVPPALTRCLCGRFFRVFGFIPMEPASAGASRRADGVRRGLQAVRKGEIIGLFPEGDIGETPAMIPAQEGSGSFMLALAARGAPIIPVGIFENDGRLHIRFGPPVDVDAARGAPRKTRDRAASYLAMTAVASLVPPEIQGSYRP